MFTKRHICTFVILFFGALLFAQDSEFITGELIDSKTNEPLVFANIRIKDRALGIITNVDGSFRIPLKYKEFGDIIEISSMGYKSKEIDLNELNLLENNLLRLEPNVEVLEEVVLVSKKKTEEKKEKKEKELRAKEIVAKAIQNISKNYPQAPYSYIGYYRDYQVESEYFANFNEAIIEVFDNGFQTNDYQNTNYKLYQYLRNTRFPMDTVGEKPYDNKKKFIPGAKIQPRRGNELLILRNMDAIRNYNVDTYSYVYQFDKDFLNNHWFQKNHDINLDEDGLYSIAISKRTPDHLIFGTILISKASFAIYKFDYEVFDRSEVSRSNDAYQILKKEVEPLFEIRVGYNGYQGLMYPDYISFSNRFTAFGPAIFRVEKLTLNALENFLVVDFSSEPDEKNVQKMSKYELSYNEKPIRIKRIEYAGKHARLYFSKAIWKNLNGKILSNNPDAMSLLKLTVNEMKDVDGNQIDVPEKFRFSQFREFFVQKVKPEVSAIPFSTKGFMNKMKPIFKDQPILRPDNFEDYWMNTPLKKNKIKKTASE